MNRSARLDPGPRLRKPRRERFSQTRVGQGDPVLDVRREVGRPGRRDDVDLEGHPRLQFDRGAAADGRVHPLVELDLVPGIEKEPEEGIAQVPVDDVEQDATGLAHVQRRIPLGDRAEVRPDQPLDVVADPVRQLGCVLDHPPCPARQRAPDPERDRERIPVFDGPVSGAQQAKPGARSGRQHEVTRQRRPVPAKQAHGVPLAQTGTKLCQQRTHATRRRAGGGLHHGQLVDLIADAQPISSIDEQAGRIRDDPGATCGPDGVGEVRGDVEHRWIAVRLPSDDPDPSARPDALVGEDRRERARPVAGLTRQAEVLEEFATHRQGCGPRHPVALVAHEDHRVAGPDDEDGLLEARVEAGQPGEVGAVLAIRVDDQAVDPIGGHALAQPLEAVRVRGGGELRVAGRSPEIGKRDIREARLGSCRVLACTVAGHGIQSSI